MHSYQAARGTFSLVELAAWAAILLGGLVALIGAGAAARAGLPGMLLGSLPGAGFALLGFFCRVYVQTARATVDCAEYAQQALEVSRNQLEQHKQLVRLTEGNTTLPDLGKSVEPTRTNQPKGAAKPVRETPLIEEYSGTTIAEQPDGTFLADNRSFDTLIDAKYALDGERLRAQLADA